MALEIRRKPDDSLDEICSEGAIVHLEQMDKKCWFLSVTVGDQSIAVWLSSGKKITAMTENRDTANDQKSNRKIKNAPGIGGGEICSPDQAWI